MIVRPELPGEERAIHDVQLAAFGKEFEAGIPAAVRATADFVPELSLVADEGGELVGHVLLSYAALGDRRVLLLGPIGIVPARQRQGIGSALVEEGLRRAEELREPMVVLEGDPRYYARFGFRPAAELGIEGPPPHAEYVQVRTLAAYEPACRGKLEYPRAFR